jgi:hypothetical protein
MNDIHNKAHDPIFKALQERTPDSSTNTLKTWNSVHFKTLPDIHMAEQKKLH